MGLGGQKRRPAERVLILGPVLVHPVLLRVLRHLQVRLGHPQRVPRRPGHRRAPRTHRVRGVPQVQSLRARPVPQVRDHRVQSLQAPQVPQVRLAPQVRPARRVLRLVPRGRPVRLAPQVRGHRVQDRVIIRQVLESPRPLPTVHRVGQGPESGVRWVMRSSAGE